MMLLLLLFKKILKWIIYLSIPIFIFGIICFYWIENSNKQFLFNDVNLVPNCKTALVLGTSHYLGNGTKNLYFSYRIEAAIKLFEAKKIKKFILGHTYEYDV